MAEGFFSRWAQRKEAVRQGRELPPEPAPAVEAPAPTGPAPAVAAPAAELAPAEAPPPPTLQDAESLTPESDFARFVKPDVAPEVKNTALKKLFSDPHFNTMDGLDVYIDDYGKPDPMPASMLRQLASAKFLNLFDEEEEEKKEAGPAGEAPTPGATPDAGGAESVAQSSTRTAQALPPAEDHADPDLRLQQDDAPGPEGPGAGPR